MAAPSDQDVFAIGALVNNTYRIERVLGRGGMGEVYLARHEITERNVAIKALKSAFTSNDMHVALMRREEAVSAVNHPVVIRYIDLGRTENGDIYLIMDFVDGEPLDKRMRSRPLGADEAVALCRRLAEGLAVCHSQGVIHRDLSPDNILLRGGRLDQPVIIDFGIAKDTGSDQTVTGGQFAGKYKYAPMEQIQGRVDQRSDLYALGVTILAAVRGQPPSFGANDFELMQNKALPLDLSDLPQPLQALLAELTDPEPSRRPNDAAALIRRIDQLTAMPLPPGDATVVAAPPGGDATVFAPAGQTVPPRTAPPPQAAAPTPGELTAVSALLNSRPEAPAAPPPPPETARKPEKKKSGGGMVTVLVALLVLGGGGFGIWQSGLLTPAPEVIDGPDPDPDPKPDPEPVDSASLPQISPYRVEIARAEDGTITASGHLPAAAGRDAIASYLSRAYPGTPEVHFDLGRGAPSETLADDLLALLRAIEPLSDWQVAISDRGLVLEGLAGSTGIRDQVTAALPDLSAYAFTADITAGPRELSRAGLAAEIAELGGCGPLAVDRPLQGNRFALGETVRISGHIAEPPDEARIRRAIAGRIGDRTLSLDLAVLNPSVCSVKRLLPPEPAADFAIWLGYGGVTDQPENPTGVYTVGDNPLIDIRLPADKTWGHLHVIAVDLDGLVYHLLPNASRQETRIEELGEVVRSERRVRVAYDNAERTDPSIIAFTIDESSGKTLVIAFHTQEQLFPVPRPFEDPTAAFADALEERRVAGALRGAEIVTKLIDTRTD